MNGWFSPATVISNRRCRFGWVQAASQKWRSVLPEDATTPGFANTPEPPYYAVIFTSQRTEGDGGYEAMAKEMFDLAARQRGCLGAETARGADGFGITVAYFSDEAAIAAWKQNARHLGAQRLGKERWYSHYQMRIAKVERSYSGPEGR